MTARTYPQANLSPFIDKIINNKASVGGARTREEVVANNLELDFEKDDFDEVVAFFNEQMKGKRIPQVAVKTPERRKAYTRLMAETQVDIDSVKQAIKNAAESDFLNGSGQKGWIADFNDPINMLEMWITDSGNNDCQFGR